MSPERYRKLVTEFDALVGQAQAVSNNLAGATVEGERSYAEAIFTKLICHALSLRKLSPSPDSDAQELWDLSSASAVARALIESYDALAYIAVHEVSESERQFRILLWELHDQQRRLKMLARVGSVDARIPDMEQRAETHRQRLLAHPTFTSLSRDVQAKIRSGDPPPIHTSQRELNEVSGVNHDYYVGATMFLSQYVHTYPISVHQLMNFRAGEPEALHLASMPLQYVLPFISKAIDGMERIWPTCAVAPDLEAPSYRTWLNIATEGVRVAG
jgi:hypothetical protein